MLQEGLELGMEGWEDVPAVVVFGGMCWLDVGKFGMGGVFLPHTRT